eukprot:438621-Prymnesium_polylepis.3
MHSQSGRGAELAPWERRHRGLMLFPFPFFVEPLGTESAPESASPPLSAREPRALGRARSPAVAGLHIAHRGAVTARSLERVPRERGVALAVEQPQPLLDEREAVRQAPLPHAVQRLQPLARLRRPQQQALKARRRTAAARRPAAWRESGDLGAIARDADGVGNLSAQLQQTRIALIRSLQRRAAELALGALAAEAKVRQEGGAPRCARLVQPAEVGDLELFAAMDVANGVHGLPAQQRVPRAVHVRRARMVQSAVEGEDSRTPDGSYGCREGFVAKVAPIRGERVGQPDAIRASCSLSCESKATRSSSPCSVTASPSPSVHSSSGDSARMHSPCLKSRAAKPPKPLPATAPTLIEPVGSIEYDSEAAGAAGCSTATGGGTAGGGTASVATAGTTADAIATPTPTS